MRPSWLIAAGAIGISGLFVAGATHENLADRVSGEQPGTVELSYYQPAPGLGKLISLGCAIGVAGCLWKGLEPQAQTHQVSNFQPSVPSVFNHLPHQQAHYLSTAPVTEPAAPQQFDYEPDISYDTEPQAVTQKSTPTTTQQVQAPNIFDRIYNNHKRHIFIPSETGGGKTTLLLGAIEYIHNLTSGTAEFYGSTAKETPWLGLEYQNAQDGQLRVLTLDRTVPSTIEGLINRLRWLQKRLKARQGKRTKAEQEGRKVNFNRVYLVLDEWLQTLAIAKEYDRVCNLSKEKDAPRSDTYNELIALIESFLLLGREDEICIWLFGQDHQVQNAKVNTGLRKNFGFVVPARSGGMLGLEDALTGRSSIATPTKGAEIFKEAEALVAQHPDTGICYSNIYGHELLIVPYLPDIKRKRIFGESPKEGKSKVVPFPKAVGSNFNPEPEPLEDYWS
jgi:hypothetical protein